MDTKAIRLKMLRQIINDKFGGVSGQLADALGMKRPQVSRWVTSNAAARQGISDDSAREIERKLGYERGWMDELSSKATANQIDEYKVAERETKSYIDLPKTKTKRSMRIEAINALLEKTDEEGLAVVLHEAGKICGQYPLVKQTPASSQ